MKLSEAKTDPTIKLLSLKKTVEVVATEKHPAPTGSVRKVPEHMVEHLLRKGMIEDPKAKPKPKKEV
jgi:hypothetical protein